MEKKMNILFIGAGKMATAIASGIKNNKHLSEKIKIKAVDPSSDACAAFKSA
jgi:pyrroline-5-carboxylate reductase